MTNRNTTVNDINGMQGTREPNTTDSSDKATGWLNHEGHEAPTTRCKSSLERCYNSQALEFNSEDRGDWHRADDE